MLLDWKLCTHLMMKIHALSNRRCDGIVMHAFKGHAIITKCNQTTCSVQSIKMFVWLPSLQAPTACYYMHSYYYCEVEIEIHENVPLY